MPANPVHPPGAEPTAAQLKLLRIMHRLTQADLAERLDVTERQVQRWEASDGSLPGVYWQLLRQTLGWLTVRDFQRVAEPTRGWDTQRDTRRDTIEQGDRVELQLLDGPLFCATVCGTHYWGDTPIHEAIVTEFVGAGGAGEEHRGLHLGERVHFAPNNVIHLEQRAPRR
ncbi:helix-turn-helix domain-containing protein [Burkholderia arboris]|uniref:helix-turn-helix domain-containing protein n=1 Tax=Burkholderia arboris TaxID=488730 RepID=UPI001CA46DBE|nr:helix-turn-helix domain-containing protein [Burkholderia arboris]MBY8608164.1 helix-turn-helix domain-containing protein [Burkholderia arboris]